MFLQTIEMKSVIYKYQMDQITEADDDIVMIAITAAEDQVKSYLRPGNKKNWQDGRPLYDVDVIFAKTGTDRNALLLEITKNIAEWYLIRLCNVDMLFENIKDRYDRDIDWLKQVQSGETVLDLPVIDPTTISNDRQPFRFGSRPKFNYE